MNKKIKTIVIGVCLILSGLSTCTLNILNETEPPVECIKKGIIETQKGVYIIKNTLNED